MAMREARLDLDSLRRTRYKELGQSKEEEKELEAQRRVVEQKAPGWTPAIGAMVGVCKLGNASGKVVAVHKNTGVLTVQVGRMKVKATIEEVTKR